MGMNQVSELNKVIDGGYCIGCGACALVSPQSVELVEDEYKRYQGRIKLDASDADLKKAELVCPFSNSQPNEDEISQKVFEDWYLMNFVQIL